MTTRQTPFDEKLSAILSASARVFAEKGYHNASIRDIAQASEVSLSGLYYYFQSKEELLFLIHEHALGTLIDRLEERLAGEIDPERRIRMVVDNQIRYFMGNMAEMKVLTHEAGSLTGDYLRQVNNRKRQLLQITSEILTELRPNNPLNPRVALFTLFGMMSWIYTWYRPDGDVPVRTLVEDMTNIYLHGYLGFAADNSPDSPLFGEEIPLAG